MIDLRAFRAALAVCCLLGAYADPALAQDRGPGGRGGPPGGAPASAAPARPADRDSAAIARPLPADQVTHHSITVGDHQLQFSATAGAIRLSNAQSGAALADVAYIAFQRDGQTAASRPVTFVFNGGPGYASGWLNLGALGPWRLPLEGVADRPSAPPILSDNADTWLDVTDLVFIDPPGTGYSRIMGGDDVRKSLWSVGGDIDALSTTIRRWVESNNRMASPKFIAGESYGGFRAPKIAHELQTDQGIGINGLIMISPALEVDRGSGSALDMTDEISHLPGYVATARALKGPITRNDLADVEAYAEGDFAHDLLRGVNDKAAVDRLVDKVAGLTGLDPTFVRRLGGHIPTNAFIREIGRARNEVASPYDGTVMGADPDPTSSFSRAPDILREGLHAPITQAMVALYHDRLNWIVEGGRYQFFAEQASRQWDWGRGTPEAIRDLKQVLALDSSLRVLIVHGLTDLVTPYFGTVLRLRQIPNSDSRIKLSVYPGGHMTYIRDASRAAIHGDVQTLIGAP